jgi:hypothetical protein
MILAKRAATADWAIRAPGSNALQHTPVLAIEDQLIAGGDPRLALSLLSGENMYGCVPHPRLGVMDLASSTASSISQEAYAHAIKTRQAFIAQGLVEGPDAALRSVTDRVRRDLATCLELHADTDIIFAPSGTDAQLKALFLVKAKLGTPLTTIVVGADQTGSGTAFTACGRHFGHATADGTPVTKGSEIGVLAHAVRKIDIPFCSPGNGFLTLPQIDERVIEAVQSAVARGDRVLLQAMDASKFGWRAPGDACLAEIARRWPDDVQVVIDACQMRLPRERLNGLIDQGFIVLITGSKFFTGPAFSGALLIPRTLTAQFSRLRQIPADLAAYTSRYDWPAAWALRASLEAKGHIGQWLRWEAALEEMRLYFAVPDGFRNDVQASLAGSIERLLMASPHLRLLPLGLGENSKGATIFSFQPHRQNVPLPLEKVAALYRAMRCDLSGIIQHESTEREILAMPCQIGQPVALPDNGAALRLSLSGRIVRDCWSPRSKTASLRVASFIAGTAKVIRKLDLAIADIDRIDDDRP